jgi:predicted Ser/Thr protein kinase
LNKDKWFFSLHASGSISIKFERETVLGKGVYGTVFREEWNNKRVAVKRIELSKCEKKQRRKGSTKNSTIQMSSNFITLKATVISGKSNFQ